MNLEVVPQINQTFLDSLRSLFDKVDFTIFRSDALIGSQHTPKIPRIETSFNGFPIFVFTEHGSSLDETGDFKIKIVTRVLSQKALENKSAAKVEVTLIKVKATKGWVAGTWVRNSDRFRFRGLGQVLWENSLTLIQKFANEHDCPITHIVEINPSRGLTREKWDKIFIPLLKKHRYKDTRDGFYNRVYKPEKF